MQTENQSHKLWKIIKSRDLALERARQVIHELRQREQKTGEAWQELQNYNHTLETKLAEKTAALAETTAALATESQRVSHLRDQLQSVEVVRSRLINELYQANHRLQESNHQLQESNHQLQQKLTYFTQKIAHFQQEIAFLSTNKAALRKLIKTLLEKIKIYDLIYRKYKFFVPVYNFIFRDKWKPSTIYRPIYPVNNNLVASEEVANNGKNLSSNKAEDVNSIPQPIDMASSKIEALLIHRQFDENIKLNSLEVISDFISTLQSVLCINPSQQILPLLQILSQKEVKVTCVGCKDTQTNLFQYGFEITNIELGDWMVATGKANLWEYDALLLNEPIAKETLMLIKGRLSPKTKVLVNGVTLND